MEIIIIAALAQNHVIGKDNKMPWHYSEDFKHFKELTTGCPILMGRKTFESIGRVLPNRRNIVMSRNPEFKIEGCDVVSSLEDGVGLCKESGVEKMFIIGGGNVYAQAMPIATIMELTLVHKEVDGNAYFPKWNFSEWKEVSREDKVDEKSGDKFSFVRYQKV